MKKWWKMNFTYIGFDEFQWMSGKSMACTPKTTDMNVPKTTSKNQGMVAQVQISLLQSDVFLIHTLMYFLFSKAPSETQKYEWKSHIAAIPSGESTQTDTSKVPRGGSHFRAEREAWQTVGICEQVLAELNGFDNLVLIICFNPLIYIDCLSRKNLYVKMGF